MVEVVIGTLFVPSEEDAEEGVEFGETIEPELASLFEGVEAGEEYGVVSVELSGVLEPGSEDVIMVEPAVVLEGAVVGPELEDVAVIVYVIHEQAELTAETSPPQFSKSVGIADGAVVVPDKNSGQKASASA